MLLSYTKFLLVPDEKIILVNRVAPVIPFLGAFIATCEWPYGRSIVYNFAGGAVKYSLIIVMASYLLSIFSVGWEAELITILAVAVLIAASYLLSLRRRSKLMSSQTGGSD